MKANYHPVESISLRQPLLSSKFSGSENSMEPSFERPVFCAIYADGKWKVACR